MHKERLHFAWLILIGLCVSVGLGKAALNNSAGLFLSPVSQDLNVGVGSLTIYLSVSSIVTLLFLPFGGKLLSKYSARLVLFFAIVLQAGAFALFGLMNSVWEWYLLAIPLAIGGVFITVIGGPVLIERWFSKGKGIALGILSAIGGLLGVFAQPIIGTLISQFGWRNTYFITGIGVLIIVAPIILLLIRNFPKDKNTKAYEDTSAGIDSHKKTQSIEGIAYTTAKKTPAFFLLGLFFFIITAISSFTMHVPTYLVNHGQKVSIAGAMMSALMVGVFVGSLVFGYLTDKIGAKKVGLLAMTLGLIAIILLIAMPSFIVIVAVALFLFGMFTSSIGTIAPAMASALFGSKDYSQIYSTSSIGLALASIVALPAYGFIYDISGSYTTGLIIIVLLFLANIIAIILAFKNKEKLVKEGYWNSRKKGDLND
ncbi:MFS transporter [Staphylococcus arlettae]|jgi:MFS family permease|uniref:MFS transporter n=1 Tax=Staphylococcus arlettae TaxID=29378 RepID=A0A380CPE8_9STAP|nr:MULTISPECIES: MFS transporter [Staphylococcus]MEB5899281.1 MFS transporter [Staphylococcus arlettae]NKE85557.1 MFS transporter [Staphylococcus arlettae]PNZ53641.1 MFS transporter [Staphylococcus arlettae]URN38894.1 MFS transporter [Staphylococcus arlettae]SUJ25556.1 Oxalate:formate exchange protein [Staphylococcus arlettae]